MLRPSLGNRPRRSLPWLLGLSVASLLGVFIALQVRWLGELAEAQLELTPRYLETAAERMASECRAVLGEVADAVRAGRAGEGTAAARLVAEVVALAPDEEPPADVPAFVVADVAGGRLLVMLDRERLEAELFPALARRALGAEGLDTYHVAVVSAANDGLPLYRSHPLDARDRSSADASADLRLVGNSWNSRTDPGGGEGLTGTDALGWTQADEAVWFFDENTQAAAYLAPMPAPWRIELRHRDGPLAVVLDRARTRNLLLAGCLLALLVAGLALLWIAEQRARRLAEKELAFVAGVSHELRTPLAVVRTAAANLTRGIIAQPEKIANYGALIERETERVSVLVERVLRFSGEEASLVLEDVDLEGVVRAAVDRCHPWRDRKRFEVRIDVAQDARTVRGDAAALTSALHNVLENAIKYGDDGETIRVRARRAKDVVVEVADSGPGVAAEDRGRLFEPFYRGAAVRGGPVPGSGLGLSVARDIAGAHGGRLELLAAKDGARGATFAFHLPPGSAS